MLFIKGIERVGHYQKQVGTRFRNLKKKEKGLSGRVILHSLQLIYCKST